MRKTPPLERVEAEVTADATPDVAVSKPTTLDVDPRSGPTTVVVDLEAPLTQKQFVTAAAIVGTISWALGFLLPLVTSVESPLVNSYYQFTWCLVILLVASAAHFWRSLPALSRPVLIQLGIAAAVGLAGAVIVFLAADTEFRILADEANLLGLSMAMHDDRTYRNILEGSYYYDAFHPSVYSLDPRPSLYPFLMTLLHDLRGYSSNHGFVVNFFSAGALFGVMYHAGRQIGGWLLGLLAAGLLLANPIFDLGATSSGFEAINLLFVTLTMWCTYGFLKEPTPRRLVLLAMVAVATCHCRYESIVILVPVAAAVIVRWNDLRFDRGSLLALAAPILLIPYAWQRRISDLHHEVDASKPVFSLRYVPDNVTQLFRFAFDRANFPMNHWIACLAVGGLVLVLWRLWNDRKDWRNAAWLGQALALTALLLILTVHMTCWVVDFRTVAVQRYAVSYASAMAALAAVPLYRLAVGSWGRIIAAGALSFIIAHGLAKAGHNTQGRWLTLYREYKMNLSFLTKQPQTGTLFISDRPGMYAVHQYGAMSFDNANKNPEGLNDGLRRKLTPNTFVEQKIYYERPTKPEPALSDKVKLEPVLEYQNDAYYYVRISKVVLP